MDRKSESIAHDIASLRKNADELKSNQLFGFDTTDLKLVQTDEDYDLTFSVPAGERYIAEVYCYDFTTGTYPFYPKAYNQILYQVWIGDLSTPYYGETSGVGIFSAKQTNSPFSPNTDMISVQMINNSLSTKVIYLKGYSITTFIAGEISVYGYSI